VRLFIIVANTLLHYLCKGANKRPSDRAIHLPDRRRPARPLPSATPHRAVLTASRPVGFFGAMGRSSVTTMSSAGHSRRDFLYIATSAAGAVGAAAIGWPLIAQMNPDASTIAAGAPIEVDLAPIAEGQVIKVFWRAKPIFISHRSKKEIDEARNVNAATLPDPQTDQQRVKAGHDQWLVLIGICTHLGCIPIAHQGQYDGFFCPCHGSVYDTSGRIRSGPAPTNLPLPPYEFVSDTKIKIG
jgi:ubiquinol-cytochrome c reductase iron-sulfur subunit